MADSPFYHLVPKDPRANLKFRRDMIRAGVDDDKAAHELWIMCARDPLFYINTFVFTYDPRREPSAIPFITYEFQDEAIMDINRAIGHEDILIEKSRDMGASWLCMFTFEYRFHFHPYQSFLCVSRKEDLVDKNEDPDCLFWKIDFIHKNQPLWLKPNIHRTKLHFYNIDNNSTIDGSSTTGDVSRGGRRTSILLDEFASVEDGYAVLKATRDATNSRIFNSTPKGTGNAFYALKQTDIRTIRLHWSKHPLKAAGLYTSDDGQVKILDRQYVYQAAYEFIADGKLRSPWYDNQRKRAAHEMEIAQELDIDYLGSDYQFFDSAVLDRLQREHVRPAVWQGDIDYDIDTAVPSGLLKRETGPLLLWIYPDEHGRLPSDTEYVLGCDISAGTGASNSCISIGDRKTKTKIGEYAVSRLKPYEFARVAVALARWLQGPSGEYEQTNPAAMIWEANGPGREFGDTVMQLGFRKFYYKTNEKSLSRKQSDIPGWFSSKEGKLALLGDYRKALSDGDFINRSYFSIAEAREYIFTQTGSVEHARSVNTVDPTGARDNHGDRVIADALCNKYMRTQVKKEDPQKSLPPNCMFIRRLKFQQKQRAKVYW